MMTNRPKTSAAILMAIAFCAPALAQAPAQIFTGQVEVVEVLLDVLVTDRKGNVILGLEADDFIVEEDDRTVAVEAATFYSNRRFVDAAVSAGRLGGDRSDIPVDRFFIFFFHDDPGSGAFVSRERLVAARRAKEWVSEGLLPNDYVAVLRYTKKLLVHLDFTTDVSAILSALDDVAEGKDPGGNWPSRIGEGTAPSLRRNLPQGKDLRDETTRIYGALQVVARASADIVGRKNLMLFSVGFGEIDSPGLIVPDRRYYPATFQALNDSNVAVYGISMLRDARISSSPLVASVDNALTALASDTGGIHYRNFVSYKTPLMQIAEDNNGYYLLSFASEMPRSESGYREVRVKTRNPEFQVRARKGYRVGG